MRMSIRSFLRCTLAAVATAAVPCARGQTPWCTFPDPLSTAEAEAMLDRVGLEGTPRNVMMQAFERYLGESLAIAREEIAPFCVETTTSPSADSREIERRIATRKRIAARLLQVDTALADALAAAAGTAGETRARLERDRLERRHWMQLVGSRFGPGDEAEFADGLVESGVVVEGDVLATLAARSPELTGSWRRLAAATADEPTEIRAAMDAAGLKRPDTDATAAWATYFEGMSRVRTEVRVRQRDIRAAIRKSQRDTERSLAALLTPEQAARLHAWFLQRSYPSLLRPRDPVPPMLADAKRQAEAGKIPPEMLVEIRTITDDHEARRSRLDARLMDLIDDRWSTGLPTRPVSAVDGKDPASDPGQEFLADRTALDRSTVERLRSKVPGLARPIEVGRESPRIPMGGDDTGAAIAKASIASDGPGKPGAKPISREDVAAWSGRLGIPDDARALIEMLLQDYLENCAETLDGPLAELLDGGDPFGDAEPTAGRRHDLMREAVEGLLGLDAEFFMNLAAALPASVDPEAIRRLGNERRRSVHLAAMRDEAGIRPRGMNEHEPFDLATTVAAANLGAEALAALEPNLVAYDAEMTPLLASSQARHAMAAKIAAVEEERFLDPDEPEEDADREGGNSPVDDEEVMDRMEAAESEMDAAKAAVRTANDAAVAAAIAALPDEVSRARLQDAVDRAAYPRVFRDQRSAGPRFDAALALPDLSPSSREAIASARAAWEAAWLRVTGELVKSSRERMARRTVGGRSDKPFSAMASHQEAMQRLRFERDEVNEKAMRALRALLTPEQAATVGDLPPAPKRGPVMFGN